MKKHILLISMYWLLICGDGLFAANIKDVHIHGFVSQGFLKTDHNNYLTVETEKGSFEFNEVGINFNTYVNDDLRIGLQFFARDLGTYGNDNIQMDWAYADYRINNRLGIRAGRLKVAYGLHNEVRDYDSVRTSIMLPMSIYTEAERDLLSGLKGIGIYGELPYGLSYQAGYGVYSAGESDMGNDIIYYLEQRLKEDIGQLYGPETAAMVTLISDDLEPMFNANAAVQWQTPLEGLRLGLSHIIGAADVNLEFAVAGNIVLAFDSVYSTVGSVEYIFGNTVLTAELSSITVKTRVEIQGEDIEKSDSSFGGGYAGISHRFFEWFELGTHYSIFYKNFSDKAGDNEDAFYFKDLNGVKVHAPHLAWEKDICISLRFDLNKYWIVKLEGHKINGAAFVDVINYKNNDIFENFFILAAKVSYSF